MALTSPSDPAASFLLLLLLLLFFLSLLFYKTHPPAPPRARGPQLPRRLRRRPGGQGGRRPRLHLLHSAGAGFQSPPGSGGERGSGAGRPRCPRRRGGRPGSAAPGAAVGAAAAARPPSGTGLAVPGTAGT